MIVDLLMEWLEDHPSDWPVRLVTRRGEPLVLEVVARFVVREPEPVLWLVVEASAKPPSAGLMLLASEAGEPGHGR